MNAHILNADELIRVLYQNQLPMSPHRVIRQSGTIKIGPRHFEISITVIDRAIEMRALVPVKGGGPGELYELDHGFIEETWEKLEDARIAGAKSVLVARHPEDDGHFRFVNYRVLLHHRCGDHDMRGFVFVDKLDSEYLVTERGSVVHLTTQVVL